MRQQGTVVRWHRDKQFGFIRPVGRPREDVFLHVTDCRELDPCVGLRVEYEEIELGKGPRAVRVTAADAQ